MVSTQRSVLQTNGFLVVYHEPQVKLVCVQTTQIRNQGVSALSSRIQGDDHVIRTLRDLKFAV